MAMPPNVRHVLRINAASCIGFGAVFLIWPVAIADVIGTAPLLLLRVLGIGLILNGLAQIASSLRSEIPRADLLLFSAGDALWVICTVLLIASGLWITSSAGIAFALMIAVFVGCCGWLQWKAARQAPADKAAA